MPGATELWRKAFGDEFFYILYFQQPGVTDADLGRDPGATIDSWPVWPWIRTRPRQAA